MGKNVVSVSCKQLQKIYGDGMNSLQNESHFGIM